MINGNMENSIESIKNIMIDVSTGKARIQDENDKYKALYKEIGKEYEKCGLKNPNAFSDLWEFYSYWDENLHTYKDRRNFVIKLYKQNNNEIHNMDLWSMLNNQIIGVAISRFETGHYADSVEASFKEINVRVKKIVKEITSKELDGSSLMKTAFSLSNPLIKLDDLDTETGRNVQLGYMELFSGSMTGIRNPKAHGNIEITKERAIHFLFLASLLMDKLDEVL
ncbi:MAG: TIGR02391 family protein [Deltaproteobacteria bacterium]|nr:TIGR02391 family protein [Deltaproteobacteria bacterium]MCL5880701.1 TIGR02391 family protein [Deltaproteobacteria bacterium]